VCGGLHLEQDDVLFARSWMNRHSLWQTASEVGPAGTCGLTPDGSDDEEQ
jgi:hypothetical protein